MKKEHFFFLTLILAAAVVTGSTIGFASNLSVILNEGHHNSPTLNEAQNIETPVPEIEEADTTEELNHPAQLASRSGTAPRETSTIDEYEFLIVSEAEKNQIASMLTYLGMKDSDNYAEFIRDFQTKHSLTPTGNLDSKTLNIIIEQVKLQKTINALKS